MLKITGNLVDDSQIQGGSLEFGIRYDCFSKYSLGKEERKLVSSYNSTTLVSFSVVLLLIN